MGYDAKYQLTGEHRTGKQPSPAEPWRGGRGEGGSFFPYRDTYTYDPAGNRLLKIHDGTRTTYAYDAANQLTYSQDVSGRTTYTFDADGNQQVVRAPSGDRTTYVWDYENRMTSVQQPSGIRNTMAYDADGLRVKLEESTGTKKFVWDDQNYLAETDAANDTQVVYTNEPRRYGNLISQRRGSDSHWYHFDAIGSTRELTDASAVITDTRLYNAWGGVLAQAGSTLFPFEYIACYGYYLQREISTFYVRRRYLDLSVGRWIALDPISYSFLYVTNRPTRRTDASGLADDEPPASDEELNPDSRPGRMNVDIAECNEFDRTRFKGKGCCCSRVNVSYVPLPSDRDECARIYLLTYVRTEEVKHYCPDNINDWHWDPPKEDMTVVTPAMMYSRPDWWDYPGGGTSRGVRCPALGCPAVCNTEYLVQEYETCAICEHSTGSQSNLGCVTYSHRCEWSYTPTTKSFPGANPSSYPFFPSQPYCPPSSISCCDVKCTYEATGAGLGQNPSAPVRVPKSPDFDGSRPK